MKNEEERRKITVAQKIFMRGRTLQGCIRRLVRPPLPLASKNSLMGLVKFICLKNLTPGIVKMYPTSSRNDLTVEREDVIV